MNGLVSSLSLQIVRSTILIVVFVLYPSLRPEIAAATTLLERSHLTQREIARQLDPNLTAKERTVVANALSHQTLIDPAIKSFDSAHIDIAVIDAATGVVTYNRPALRGSLSTRWRIPTAMVHSRLDPLAYSIALKEYAGTGPYRQLTTAPNVAQTSLPQFLFGEIATLNTPCSNGNAVNKALPDGSKLKDVGELYMGGVGQPVYVSASSYVLHALDTGLQYNKDIIAHKPAGQNSLDDYSLFFNGDWGGAAYAGTVYDVRTGEPIVGTFGHVPCSQYPVTVSFSVNNYTVGITATTQFVTTARFYDYRFGYQRTLELSYVYQGPNVGWSATCGLCILKRMTSIAQTPKSSGGPGDNFTNGDHFKGIWTEVKLTCGMIATVDCNTQSADGYWDYATTAAGGACDEHPHWYTIFAYNGRDCSNTPTSPANQGAGIVGVSNYYFYQETDALNLPVPLPPPGP